MLGFLKRIFSNGGKYLRIENFQLWPPIKWPTRISTPCGSRVTVIAPYVDVDYRVNEGRLSVCRVRMSQGGTTILGSRLRVNITAESTGEAFFVRTLSPMDLLFRHVVAEVAKPTSGLRRKMYGKWRHSCRLEVRPALIRALNEGLPAEHIRQLIGNAGVIGHVAFFYKSPQRGIEDRVVTVRSVQGESIEATDHKDGNAKTFRIDRISNARPA